MAAPTTSEHNTDHAAARVVWERCLAAIEAEIAALRRYQGGLDAAAQSDLRWLERRLGRMRRHTRT